MTAISFLAEGSCIQRTWIDEPCLKAILSANMSVSAPVLAPYSAGNAGSRVVGRGRGSREISHPFSLRSESTTPSNPLHRQKGLASIFNFT